MRIINGKVLTMEGETFECGYVDFENGVITALGDMASAPAYTGETVDARGGYVLPGFIDAHSHIGISEENVRWEGEDCNEMTDPVTPQLRAIDAIFPFDTAFPRASAAGVTSAVVGPGSANVIGGQMAAIKMHGENIDEMVIKAPCAMKMALGENPKNCYGNAKKAAPQTRMASASLMREALIKAQRYMAKKEKDANTEYDAKCEALLPVLRGEIPAHIHCHRCDDIETAIRVAKEFGIRYNIIHTSDARRAAKYIAAADIMPVIGPLMGISGKPETSWKSFENGAVLEQHGVEVAITTDHPVLPLEYLNINAALCVKAGMSEQAALRALTINAAKIGGVEDRVGSLKVGKDADIAVYDGHPFEIMTRTIAVFISGARVK
ncbi:MAG: hypothetical protein ABT01_05775 [Clostridium sp. SCN 57-10]|nr:MAG: hypothetical protein ABT01_05775 [Clostridium sp. SCN 57-10]